jgi:hypothetical protein
MTVIVARGLAALSGRILFGGRWIVHCGSPVPTGLAFFRRPAAIRLLANGRGIRIKVLCSRLEERI